MEVFTTKDPILLLARAILWISDRVDPTALASLQCLALLNKKTYALVGDHADLRAAQLNYKAFLPEEHHRTAFFGRGGTCSGEWGICQCFGTAKDTCACVCHVKCKHCFASTRGRYSSVDNDAISDGQCRNFQRCLYALHEHGSYRVGRYYHGRAKVFFPLDKLVSINKLISGCHVSLLKRLVRVPGFTASNLISAVGLHFSFHEEDCEMMDLLLNMMDKQVSSPSERCEIVRNAAITGTPGKRMYALVARYPDTYRDANQLKKFIDASVSLVAGSINFGRGTTELEWALKYSLGCPHYAEQHPSVRFEEYFRRFCNAAYSYVKRGGDAVWKVLKCMEPYAEYWKNELRSAAFIQLHEVMTALLLQTSTEAERAVKRVKLAVDTGETMEKEVMKQISGQTRRTRMWLDYTEFIARHITSDTE